MKKHPVKFTILIFSTLTIALSLLFQLSKFSFFGQQEYREIMIVLIGGLFIGIGFILHRLFYRTPKTDTTDDVAILQKAQSIGLSEREHEILVLISKGLSNQEIANQLFISENTVKTHVSKILTKLNAKRRTHAVQIARDLNVI